jgi:serine/threonine protein kinase
VSRYRLQKPLGRGGMAEVFLAQDEDAGRKVVVKRILPQFVDDSGFQLLFADEARLAVQLDHENIVRVIDVGLEHGDAFMALEWIDGVDIDTLITLLDRRGERAHVRVAAAIVLRVLAALHYAHHTMGGVIHRDVTPSNVLLARDGRVKLADFGVARCVEHVHRTVTGVLVGKPGYTAPEQLGGANIDARADVYGAAALFYALLFGRAPDDGTRPYRVPEVSAPDLPVELGAVIARALSIDPTDRPASARAFADEIERTLGDASPVGPSALASLVKRVRPPPIEEESTAKVAAAPGTVSAEEPAEVTVRVYNPLLSQTAVVPEPSSTERVSRAPASSPYASNGAVAAMAALTFVAVFVLVLAVRFALR